MFTKKHLKESLSKDFESFLNADISDIKSSSEKSKNRRSNNDFKTTDDDSSQSSSLRLGTGKSFMKKPDLKAPVVIPLNHDDSDNENIPEIVVQDISEEQQDHKYLVNNDLKLNLSLSNDKSEFEESCNKDDPKFDGYPHPVTFEGITEPSFERRSMHDFDEGNRGRQSLLFDRNRSSEFDRLNETKNDHLLSKVSLLDSNEYGRLDRTSGSGPLAETSALPAAESSDQPAPQTRQQPDLPGFVSNKSSLNPASGDSYNNTQGITNITDTVIGDTTAADLAAMHRLHAETYSTGGVTSTFQGDRVPSQLQPDDHCNQPWRQPTQADYLGHLEATGLSVESALNESGTESTNSFGVKLVRLDELEDQQQSSPTPRQRTSKSISRPTHHNSQHTVHQQSTAASSRPSPKYSHIKSSGYGVVSSVPPTAVVSERLRPTSRGRKTRPDPQTKSTEARNHGPKGRNKSRETTVAQDTYIVRSSFDEFENGAERQLPFSSSNGNKPHDEWHEKWLEERRLVKKLQADSNIQERDFRNQLKSVNKKYEDRISQLEKMLNHYKQRAIPDLANKEPGASVSKEDLDMVQKEIQQQETIILGYQRDNERLYQEIKSLKLEKQSGTKLDSVENERLMSQLVSLNVELESRDIELRNLRKMTADMRTHGNPGDSGAKEAFYVSEIRQLKTDLENRTQKLFECQSEKQMMEKRLDKLVLESERAISELQRQAEVEVVEKQKLKDEQQLQVADLKKKIKWYLENQAILDKDTRKLRHKDEEVADLRRQLQSSETIKISSNIRAKEKISDTNRIRRLEEENQSLKEDMYKLLKSKNPSQVAEKRSVQFLEERIREMENLRDVKVDDENLALRSLQQQFESLKHQYEEKIRDLELDLDRGSRVEKETRVTGLTATVARLQKQINQKDMLVKRLQKNSVDIQQQPQKKEANGKNNIRRVELPIEALKKQLRDKEVELQRLEIQNHYLKSMEKTQQASLKPLGSHLELEAEFAHLKAQLAHAIQEQNHLRAALADEQCSRETGEQLLHQKHETEMRHLNEYHTANLCNVRANFATRHSESDVTALRSQLESQREFVNHLQAQLATQKSQLEDAQTRDREHEAARQQLAAMEAELRDLRVIWTARPGLEMIDRLRARIRTLETQQSDRGHCVDEYVEKMRKSLSSQHEEELSRLRDLVTQKNLSLLKVQQEVSQLLQALEELRRQGVTLPLSSKIGLLH